MRNRVNQLIVLLVMTIGILIYLLLDKREVVNSAPASVVEVGFDGQAAIENRLSSMERQIDEISDTVKVLASVAKQNSERTGLQEESSDNVFYEDLDTPKSLGVSESVDPFSPEGIALADKIQNDYINRIDEIYGSEELDPEWAESVESAVLPKLADVTTLAMEGENGEKVTPADISVASFECRAQLCATEIITGSMQEMLSYQNYMVNKTKSELPSIVFGVIEPYGSKFKMKAFLARDEYEFPQLRQ